MIKFIPQLKDVKSPLSDPEGFTDNMASKSLAAQMENRIGDEACPDHPEFENTIWVHYSSNGEIMSVDAYCCKYFKEKLDLVANNQNPFQ